MATGAMLLAVVVGAFVTSIVVTPPRVANACSAGPDFNPAASSELIVAGYITDMEILGRTGVMTYLDLRMTFEVDQYLYGGGATVLPVFDGVSGVPLSDLVPNTTAFAALDLSTLSVDDLGFDGGGGACGALDEDPRGRYWVVGLGRNPETGRLRMNRLATFAIGSSAADPAVVAGITRARGLLVEAGRVPVAASAGNAGLAGDASGPVVSWGSLGGLLGVLLLLTGARHVTGRWPR